MIPKYSSRISAQFQNCEEIFRHTFGKEFTFDKTTFLQVLVTNLVDSNVFVRSVVLSLDSFKRCRQYGAPVSSSTLLCSPHYQETMSSDNYKLGNTRSSRSNEDSDDFCMITAFVSHNTLRLIRDLMCAVRLSDINQVTENPLKNLTSSITTWGNFVNFTRYLNPSPNPKPTRSMAG